jgi:hypothetical protein
MFLCGGPLRRTDRCRLHAVNRSGIARVAAANTVSCRKSSTSCHSNWTTSGLRSTVVLPTSPIWPWRACHGFSRHSASICERDRSSSKTSMRGHVPKGDCPTFLQIFKDVHLCSRECMFTRRGLCFRNNDDAEVRRRQPGEARVLHRSETRIAPSRRVHHAACSDSS